MKYLILIGMLMGCATRLPHLALEIAEDVTDDVVQEYTGIDLDLKDKVENK